MSGFRYTRADTIHGLFGWCARRWPSATAIVHADRTVSYAELDALSDCYAAELADAGVGPGDFVPVLQPRSPEFVAVLLAVLKRGAAYAALDPSWPRARVEALIITMTPPLIVTAAPGPWPVAAWAPPSGAARSRGRRPARAPADASTACNVWFTSGSTGEPKGVVARHGGTVRLFDTGEFLDLGPHAVMPQINAVPWDGFTMDCWGPLTTGGTCVIVDEPLLVPRTLRDLVTGPGITLIALTVTLFNMLVDADVTAFAGLRQVITGGERLSPRHCRLFLDAHPGIELHGLYGPAESSVYVTSRRVRPGDCDDPDGIPLGREERHSEVYVLDSDRVCQPGEVGELCIGGAGLAAGYLGDAALTATRFVTASQLPGTPRVYHTGDLGHRAADGTLYFDGRGDRQVKIHGHRIELAEVEQNVLGHPDVTACTAVAVPAPDGGYDGVAACYQTASRTPVTEPELRAWLAARLPGYLVPRWIRRLDSFPLTGTGKTDARALVRMISFARLSAPEESGPALTGTAAVIASAIRGVLGDVPVSADTNLLEAAGTSLEAARLCVAVEDALGLPVPASRLFREPTVTALAAWAATAARPPGHASSDTRDRESGPADQVLLTPMQLMPLFASGTDSERCTFGWWYAGSPDPAALAAAAGDVHARHEALRARYLTGEQPAAVVPRHAPGPEFRCLPQTADDEAALAAARRELAAPLDIGAGRVWRLVMITSAASGRTLVGVTVHHIAIDGFAGSLLASDLSAAYTARLGGTPPRFARAAPTLAEVSAEHLRHLRVTDMGAQFGYWRGHLQGLPELSLPGRRPGEPPATGPTMQRRRLISPAAAAPWAAYARAHHMSAFTCLLAAFHAALSKISGQADFGILVPVALRGRPQMDRAVTCRVNFVCLRLTGPSGQRRLNLLERARQVVAEAMAAQDVPFGAVAQAIGMRGGGRTLRRAGAVLERLPVFAYQDNSAPTLALTGCDAQAPADLEMPGVSTEYELKFELCPASDSGLTAIITVRTDLVPGSLADDVAAAYLGTIEAGPDQLASYHAIGYAGEGAVCTWTRSSPAAARHELSAISPASPSTVA